MLLLGSFKRFESHNTLGYTRFPKISHLFSNQGWIKVVLTGVSISKSDFVQPRQERKQVIFNSGQRRVVIAPSTWNKVCWLSAMKISFKIAAGKSIKKLVSNTNIVSKIMMKRQVQSHYAHLRSKKCFKEKVQEKFKFTKQSLLNI